MEPCERHTLFLKQAWFSVFLGDPLHGYRVCIQAIMQDKPKIATQNLPMVGAILSFASYLIINRSRVRRPTWLMNLPSFSIWSSCGQSRTVLSSVWPSCGLWAKLGFMISARGCEVKLFLPPPKCLILNCILPPVGLSAAERKPGLSLWKPPESTSADSHEPQLVIMFQTPRASALYPLLNKCSSAKEDTQTWRNLQTSE